MTIKLRPLHNRVLVKRQEEETTSKGGIVLPGSATEKPMQGEVVAVGAGKRLETGELVTMDLKIGDTILFGKYAGTEVKLEDNEFVMMSEDDVMAVVE